VEEELLENKAQHNDVNKNKISLQQFKKETKKKTIETIAKISTKKNLTTKGISTLSDFFIDTLAITKHISQNNKITYAFRIYPLNQNSEKNIIFNLIYRKKNERWVKYIFALYKKNPSQQDTKLFKKIEMIYDDESTISATGRIVSNELCSYETPIVRCDGSCESEGYPSCDGFSCATRQCIGTSVNYLPCGGNGGSVGNNPNTDLNSGGAGGAGGTTDPYVFESNLYENPDLSNPDFFNLVKRGLVWSNLSADAQSFFASNPENMNYFNQVIQYQIDEKWSQESYVFAQEMFNYSFENNFNGIIVPAINQFVKEMINSMVNNHSYSSDGFMGDTDYDNINYSGPKQLIPKSIILNDGSTLTITFGTTQSDNKNSNNEVAVDLVNSIKFAINLANSKLENSNKITSIYIAATTNGTHSSTSNHTRGTAVDISRINGIKMINLGNNIQVKALQDAFDNYPSIRENFGPSFKHKTFPNGSVNLNWPIGGHQDHIHVSVQSY
jgi:hypothetical protein